MGYFFKNSKPHRPSFENSIDDNLSKTQLEAQNARDQLEESLFSDDESVNMIMREAGLQRKGKGRFDYDAADRKIKQKEQDARRRREEMSKRLRLKELQFFPESATGVDTNTKDEVESIDATMRKHSLGQDSSKDIFLKPSPLPKSPPDNIKRWREKLRQTDYELPSQEENRLLSQWHKSRKDKMEPEAVKSREKHNSIDSDVFYSFTTEHNSPVKTDPSKPSLLVKQIEDLQAENDRLKQQNRQLEREKDYWKHETNIISLEKKEVEKVKLNLEQRFQELKFKYNELQNSPLIVEPAHRTPPKRSNVKKFVIPSHNSTIDSGRLEFDVEDTAQLIKFASNTLEFKPVFK